MLVSSHNICKLMYIWNNADMTSHIPSPRQSHPDLHSALASVPHIAPGGPILTAREITAGHYYLKKLSSGVPEQTSAHVDRLMTMTKAESEPLPGQKGVIALREHELRALLANAALTGATQAAYAICRSLSEAEKLRELVGSMFEASSGDSDAGALAN